MGRDDKITPLDFVPLAGGATGPGSPAGKAGGPLQGPLYSSSSYRLYTVALGRRVAVTQQARVPEPRSLPTHPLGPLTRPCSHPTSLQQGSQPEHVSSAHPSVRTKGTMSRRDILAELSTHPRAPGAGSAKKKKKGSGLVKVMPGVQSERAQGRLGSRASQSLQLCLAPALSPCTSVYRERASPGQSVLVVLTNTGSRDGEGA